MRRFIVLAHEAPTSPDFSLDDLPGSAGRLDIIVRSVTAGLLSSHGVRSDVDVVVVVQDQLVIQFAGESIRGLHPDERSTAARFRDALRDARDAVGTIAVESSPGVTVRRGDLASVLDDPPAPIVQLHEDGDPLPDLSPTDSITYVLSDHQSFSESDETTLAEAVDRRVSVGPMAVHADHAITIAHNYIDTDGYRRYERSEPL